MQRERRMNFFSAAYGPLRKTEHVMRGGLSGVALWTFVRSRLKAGLQYVRWVCVVVERRGRDWGPAHGGLGQARWAQAWIRDCLSMANDSTGAAFVVGVAGVGSAG